MCIAAPQCGDANIAPSVAASITALFQNTATLASSNDSFGANDVEEDDRATIDSTVRTVELGQPTLVSLSTTTGHVASIMVSQHDDKEELKNRRGNLVLGSGNAKVASDDGLTKLIEVIPLQLGLINVDFSVGFEDGALAHKSYQLNVIPSSKGLVALSINHGFSVLPIVLEDKADQRQVGLSPEAYYDQLDYPIHLTDSSKIKFTVEQSSVDPVIRLDSDGMVHGLRQGHAKITADFSGLQDSVTVWVYSKEEPPQGYRGSSGEPH